MQRYDILNLYILLSCHEFEILMNMYSKVNYTDNQSNEKSLLIELSYNLYYRKYDESLINAHNFNLFL